MRKRLVSLCVILAIITALFAGCSDEKDTSALMTTESTTEETTTEKVYPPAEELNVIDIVSYETNNTVKRNKYLDEVKRKRYVFYLEVDEVKSEKVVWGKLYPSDQFVINEDLGRDAYNTFARGQSQNLNGLSTEEKYVYTLNFIFWDDPFSVVTFNDEIWETLEKGDKITIEGSITDDSKLELIGWNLDVEDAVIVSKQTKVTSDLPE